MSKQFSSDSPTIEEILRVKKPREVSADVFLDKDAGEEIMELLLEIERLKQQPKNIKRDLATKPTHVIIEEKQKEVSRLIEEAEVATFTFRDIGRLKYDTLLRNCPPTEDDQKDWERNGNKGQAPFNEDKFVPGLIAACAASPTLTLEDATRIYNEWGRSEVELLFSTAIKACTERTDIPLFRIASAMTQNFDSKQDTASSEESPTPNS